MSLFLNLAQRLVQQSRIRLVQEAMWRDRDFPQEKRRRQSRRIWMMQLMKNKLLAEGYTVNVFIGKKTMKSARIPDELRKALQG